MRLIARTDQQLRQAYERLRNEKGIAVDTETAGLHPFSVVIHSVQLSTEDGTFSALVPRRSAEDNSPRLGPLLGIINSPAHLKLGQNTPFDIKMMDRPYPELR